jgi:hypothetical protein
MLPAPVDVSEYSSLLVGWMNVVKGLLEPSYPSAISTSSPTLAGPPAPAACAPAPSPGGQVASTDGLRRQAHAFWALLPLV